MTYIGIQMNWNELTKTFMGITHLKRKKTIDVELKSEAMTH